MNRISTGTAALIHVVAVRRAMAGERERTSRHVPPEGTAPAKKS